MKVFVYGTLKRGLHNYSVMEGARGRYLKDDSITGCMYSLGAFPFVDDTVPEGQDSLVSGEVFEVEDLAPLDWLEGHPDFYERKKIVTLSGESVWVYLIKSGDYPQAPLVEGGVWA